MNVSCIFIFCSILYLQSFLQNIYKMRILLCNLVKKCISPPMASRQKTRQKARKLSFSNIRKGQCLIVIPKKKRYKLDKSCGKLGPFCLKSFSRSWYGEKQLSKHSSLAELGDRDQSFNRLRELEFVEQNTLEKESKKERDQIFAQQSS